MAARLGIGGAVELPGPIEGEAYWRTLRGADLAIQLPAEAEGERVGAGLRLARGPGAGDRLRAGLGGRAAEAGGAAACGGLLRAGAGPGDGGGARRRRPCGRRSGRPRTTTLAENSFTRVAERYAELLAL